MSEIAVHVPENVRDGLKYMLWTGCGMARKNEVVASSCCRSFYRNFKSVAGHCSIESHPAKGPKTSSVSFRSLLRHPFAFCGGSLFSSR